MHQEVVRRAASLACDGLELDGRRSDRETRKTLEDAIVAFCCWLEHRVSGEAANVDL